MEGTVPQYRLECLGLMGYGGLGYVTLERDEITDTCFAMKQVPKMLLFESDMRHAMPREKAILLHLDSPYIVKLSRGCVLAGYHHLYQLCLPKLDS